MRCMATSPSKLIDNLTEGIHKTKYKICGCFLEYESVKYNLIKYKCLSCNKEYSNKFDEELKKKFKNIFKFFNSDINRFILQLRKRVYLEYISMNIWIIGKSLMKQHYLKKKNFIVT